jgi:hypothetical protein
MRIRASAMIGLGLLSLSWLALLSAQVRAAKAPEIKAPDASWKVPRTPWGHPDLQGVWTSDDLQGVPVERPKEYGTRRFLTEQEMKDRDGYVGRIIQSAETGERPKEGFWASQKGVDAAAVPANWVEFARRASALTSLVSDPPDGRIPPLTEEAVKRSANQPNYTNMRPQSYKDMTWYDRCVSRGVTAGFFPSIYGNGSEFVQTPDTVAVRYEMIHETRLIPLAAPGEADRPRNSSKMRSYMGEPRGHWEGDTLVVETKNFIGGRLAITFAPYSEDLTLVERFRRTGPQTLEYSVTVNDPRTYTAPWTATFPLTSEPGYQIFEYACHEGNYAMRNRLSAARAEEARDAARQAAGGK